jgi:hypothetical protein
MDALRTIGGVEGDVGTDVLLLGVQLAWRLKVRPSALRSLELSCSCAFEHALEIGASRVTPRSVMLFRHAVELTCGRGGMPRFIHIVVVGSLPSAILASKR